jgi:hypothetical protein
MADSLSDALKLLGFATPFVYAAATFTTVVTIIYRDKLNATYHAWPALRLPGCSPWQSASIGSDQYNGATPKSLGLDNFLSCFNCSSVLTWRS